MSELKSPFKSRSTTPETPDDADGVQILSDSETQPASEAPKAPEGGVGFEFTDDATWEDEPGYNVADPYEKSASPLPLKPVIRPVRKRKVTGRKVSIPQSSSTRKSKRKVNLSEDGTASPVNINKEHVRDALGQGASHSVSYVSDVVKTALWLLRKPLSVILSVCVLAYLLAATSSAFRTVFSPICWVPGISRIPLCTPPKVSQGADYPKLAELQGSTFEQLLDETSGSSALSLEIKNAEMATSDLVALVKVSEFRSKDTLAEHLEAFVGAAKRTNRGLQKLTSRVGGALDSIIAANDYALHTIEDANVKSKSLSRRLNPFSNALTTQQVVAQTFTDAMSILSVHMRRLVVEAETSMENLDRLGELLDTLHEMVSRENAGISAQKEELLAELWTILGGNRKKLRGMEGNLFLLRHIGQYRTSARAHVAAALQTLIGMSEDMEDLRERVSAPELIGDKIPVEVHMKAIHASLERLQVGRTNSQQREETYKRLAGIEGNDYSLE